MIYLVSTKKELFGTSLYRVITVEESLDILSKIKIVGLDTETSGLDVHTNELLTLQLGNFDNQIVIDCTTIDVSLYKEYLESDRLFLAHNYKFDGKWLIDKHIYIKKVYDTFIAEKVIYLGLPVKCSLQEVAKRRLNVWLDKSIRGDIIVNGLSEGVIEYAAKDVKYLEGIYKNQYIDIIERDIEFSVKLECAFTSALAYMEYCGIKLDTVKWSEKMAKDEESLHSSEKALNEWVVDYCTKKGNIPVDIWDKGKKNTKYPPNVYAVLPQSYLFEEFNTGPLCVLNWSSSEQLIPLFEELGFNVWTKDKVTGEPKKSVDTRILKLQKDKSSIVSLLLKYSAAKKRTTSFGKNYIEAVNKTTRRIHPDFNQLISSGRMSCGKGNSDSEDINTKDASINTQQLPNDKLTRECFISEEGNSIIAADYGDQEGHQFANLTKDKAWLDFYNDPQERDGHSFVAKMIFTEELKDIEEKDVKKKRPDLRQAAKAPRFR